jgi:hypothetical protein
MAKRLDDTEDRPPTHRHPEVEAAEFEAERPARDLSGLPKLPRSTRPWPCSCSGWPCR